MLILPRSRLVFIGDSITDAGRNQPLGEGIGDPFGRGYVALVDALLTCTYPAHAIRITNVGSSGHTVRELAERWDRDVIHLKPDYLAIMIGVNDVWRQFDSPRRPETHVTLEEYEATLTKLVERTRPLVKGLILMTPFHIENLKQDLMRTRMTQYADVVRRLAPHHNAILVDVQAAFDKVLGVDALHPHMHSSALAWDRIHPSQAGHMTIAKALLTAIGYQW